MSSRNYTLANVRKTVTMGSTYAGEDVLSSAKLQLNGHDRFDERDATYFNVVNFATKSNDIMVF